MPYRGNTMARRGTFALPNGTVLKESSYRPDEWQRIINGTATQRDLGGIPYSMYKSATSSGSAGYGGNPYIDEYKKAYAEAKAANEKRYEEILQGYNERYGRGMGYINSLSNQQEADAREAGQMRMGNMEQDLVSRGLTGTTIKPTQEALINRETDANVRRIEDEKLRERLATDASLSGDTLGFMERREDIYPDMNLYANLMQQYGRYGSAPSVRRIGGTRRKDDNGYYGGGRHSKPMNWLADNPYGGGKFLGNPETATYSGSNFYAGYRPQTLRPNRDKFLDERNTLFNRLSGYLYDAYRPTQPTHAIDWRKHSWNQPMMLV